MVRIHLGPVSDLGTVMNEAESTPTPTLEPKAYHIRDEIIGEMAAILYDIAPPDGQRIIARLLDELRDAVLREAINGK